MSAGSGTLARFLHLLILAAAGWSWRLPPGFPAPRVPEDNPMSAEKVALGRRLFYDVRLSGNGTQACSSCHQQKRAFTDGRARALGSTGETHPRSAMSLANAAYGASLTWIDAGHRRLEDQMLVPLLGEVPLEMGLKGHEDEAVARLRADPLYSSLFTAAFPGAAEPRSLVNIRKAIASFERTILSGDSPYDRLVWKDDRGALSEAGRRGMALFFSDPLACSKCHAGFTFSGPVDWEGAPPPEATFHDNGVGGKFRAPTLRNIAITSPYMHDGRFATLEDVVEHYARGGTASPDRSSLIKGFTVTESEKHDLVEFLKSLTDEAFLTNPSLSDPWPQRNP
jgi:cytochrome c peroxidase